jgi:putative redox protein
MSITVRRDGITGTRHIVRIRGHEIPVDATPEAGGKDAGPGPHDIYDASLGACKALTVLVYAQHKGIPVEEIEVTVERDASEERKGTYRLDTSLRITGNLSEAQRADLLRVAGRCPVHRLMTEVRTEIQTRLV